jgi:hypothetical protein
VVSLEPGRREGTLGAESATWVIDEEEDELVGQVPRAKLVGEVERQLLGGEVREAAECLFCLVQRLGIGLSGGLERHQLRARAEDGTDLEYLEGPAVVLGFEEERHRELVAAAAGHRPDGIAQEEVVEDVLRRPEQDGLPAPPLEAGEGALGETVEVGAGIAMGRAPEIRAEVAPLDEVRHTGASVAHAVPAPGWIEPTSLLSRDDAKVVDAEQEPSIGIEVQLPTAKARERRMGGASRHGELLERSRGRSPVMASMRRAVLASEHAHTVRPVVHAAAFSASILSV